MEFIKKKRTGSIAFLLVVFLQFISRSLDYHPTFAEYRDVRKNHSLIICQNGIRIINIDDKMAK
jgi:UDP-N-acetylmuramoyl-L-alanyl-D-glutamate--2,6-diaminopimelate ligase